MSKHTSGLWRAAGLPSGAVMRDQVYPMYRKAVLKAVIGIVGLAAEAGGEQHAEQGSLSVNAH